MYFHNKTIPKKDISINTIIGPLDFKIAKSRRRRTIAIYVDDDASVCVYAPSYADNRQVISFINEKLDWIFDKIEEARKRKNILKSNKFTPGNKSFFLGKKYKINTLYADIKISKIAFDGINWTIILPNNLLNSDLEDIIKDKMVKWYKTQAKEIIGGRLLSYSRIVGVEPRDISIKTQKRLWGNCDCAKSKININWQIILFPIHIVDYIIVHELCHLIVPNHSARFWKKVEKTIPDFKIRRKWLKKNSMYMVLPI